MSGFTFFSINIIRDILYLTVLTCSAFGWGAGAISLIGYRDRSDPMTYTLAASLGLGLLSHLMLVIAGLHLLRTVVAWLILVIGVLLFLVQFLIPLVRRKITIRLPGAVTFNLFTISLLLLFTFAILFPLLGNSLVPQYSYDDWAYHLAIPKIYIHDNSLSYISFIPHSNWPLGTEMLFTLSLLIGSENLARLISWLCLFLTSASLFLFSRRYFSGEMSLLAALLFASTPMTLQLTGTAMIELPLALYSTLAIITLFEWLEKGQPRDWISSALFGGLAASTKLNAALVPFVLGLLMLISGILTQKGMFWKHLKRFIFYGLIALLVVLPWYLKSWIQTGNPIFPYAYDILGGRNWDVEGSKFFLGFIQSINMPINLRNWLTGLWIISFRLSDFGPYYLGYYYLFLMPLAIPAAIWLPEKRQRIIILRLIILAIVFYTAWFFQTHQTRFMMIFLGIFVLLASIGFYWIINLVAQRSGILFEWGVKILLIGFLVVCCWPTIAGSKNRVISIWPFLSGQITRDQYMNGIIPGYQTFIYANRHLPVDAYVWMAVWESRGYFLDRRYMWANPISQRDFVWEQFDDPDQLADELHRRGFSHILFQKDNLYKFPYPYNEKVANLVSDMLQTHARLIYSAEPIELYRLKP